MLAYTLLEVAICLVVITVITLAAAPSFEAWTARQQMRAALQSLQQDLLQARSAAITQGAEVVACPGGIDSGCRSDRDWSGGWLVFQDFNGDRDLTPTEPVLRQSPPTERLKVLASGNRPSFRFVPSGGAPGSNGSLYFCGSAGPSAGWRLVVSNTGRIRREEYHELEQEDCPDN